MNHETLYENVSRIEFGRIATASMGNPLPHWIRFDLSLGTDAVVCMASDGDVLGFLAQLDTLGEELRNESQRIFRELKERQAQEAAL